MNMMRLALTTCLVLLAATLRVAAQATDKADADKLVFQELSAQHEVENWHPELIVRSERLEETAEQGVYVLRGDSFQVSSLRSDVYLRQAGGEWTPIFDGRYPVESLVNLLMNRVVDNRHLLTLRHHQYGGTVPTIIMPMQTLFDVLGRTTDSYCSVNAVTRDEMRAVLVFHQRRLNYIHMLELRVAMDQLTQPDGMLTADLYTNIPQNGVLNVFTERKK